MIAATLSHAFDGFPYTGTLQEKLEHIIGYAQGLEGRKLWEAHVSASGVEVSIGYAVADQRQAVVAAGTGIHLIRLAMRCHLMEPNVDLEPEHGKPYLIARISQTGECHANRAEQALFRQAIGAGHSLSTMDEDDLAQAAADHGARLRFIEADYLRKITSSLYREGDELEMDTAQQQDFLHWMRPIGANSGDASLDRLAVICTKYEDVKSWVAAGEALCRVQLMAASAQVASSTFNQPLLIPGVRAKFAMETGFCNFPQVVLQMRDRHFAAPQSPHTAQDKGCGCGCEGCKGKEL